MNEIHLDPAWLWLIGGVLLLSAELIAPGYSLIFIGAAGICTGMLAVLLGLSVPLQLAVFIVLALLAVRVGGRRFYASRYDHTSHPSLNDPTQRLLGRVVIVSHPVDANGGRVRVGDSEWSARGGPAAAGERVRIVDIDGNCLKVEPEHVLPPA